MHFEVDHEGRGPVAFNNRARINEADGRRSKATPTLGDLAARVGNSVLTQMHGDSRIDSRPDDAPIPVECKVDMPEMLRLRVGKKDAGVILGAVVKGTATWKTSQYPMTFKILIRDRDETPFVGCLVANVEAVGLFGLALQNVPAPVTTFHVPVSDRNLKVIHRLPVPRR